MKKLLILLSLAACTKEPPPPPSQNVVYVDFAQSTMPASLQRMVIDSTAALFAGFDITITKDAGVYERTAPQRRQQVIVTRGVGSGKAITGSFGTGHPAYVYETVGPYMLHRIIAHEIGHTLGLRHQSLWEGGKRVEEYRKGFIMGDCFGIVADWGRGENSTGEIQDDRALIVGKLQAAPTRGIE